MGNNKLGTAAAIVVLVAISGGVVYQSLRSSSASGELVGLERWVGCESCGQVYWGVLDARPGTCSHCRESALWAAGVCRDPDCSHRFPVNTLKLRAEGREVYCPKCRSSDVGKILDPPPSG